MRILRPGYFAGLAMLTCCVAQADETSRPPPRIELHAATKTARAAFDVVGLTDRELSAFAKLPPPQKSAAFAVFVDADLDDPPPIVGSLTVDKNVLRFTPRYPLEPGLTYRAVLDRGKLSGKPGDVVATVFPIPKPDLQPTTVVEQIYPTSDRLPDNHLKFYIHFSAPMSRGEAYRHVHLVDSDGKEVEAVFLELGEELWDGTGQRFTLYFEPGRVKRGLRPREELGPVLHEGRSYSLVIDKDWRDATRVPLKAGARKTFSVGPPDEAPIDPASWKLETPAAGRLEPLVVRFGEPLDHAELERVVWVATDSGEKVAGSIVTAEGESRWQFTPKQPWSAGKYNLTAETTLEDLAGNSIGRPFEVDEFGPVRKQIDTETVSVPFTIAPAP
jgi:Bacterial Ig-like domain